jgi:hypothetical protein
LAHLGGSSPFFFALLLARFAKRIKMTMTIIVPPTLPAAAPATTPVEGPEAGCGVTELVAVGCVVDCGAAISFVATVVIVGEVGVEGDVVFVGDVALAGIAVVAAFGATVVLVLEAAWLVVTAEALPI